MKCHNHPSAPAIENCARCEIPLCGMCANFVGNEVLCEPCTEVREHEKTVATKAEELERPDPVPVQAEYDEALIESARKKETNWQIVQIGIIALCAIILIARAFLLSGDEQPVEINAEEQAQMQILSSLAQCMVLFQQIGESLTAGETPDPATTCPGSNLPIIITETSDDVLVEHPEPDVYGYAGIVVSRSDPAPRIIQ